jgi:hypothetical protein
MVRHWRKIGILYKYASKLRAHSGIDSAIPINYHLLNQELRRLSLLRRAKAVVGVAPDRDISQ